MSDCEGFKRKSKRTAAIEAAKRIKNNADDNGILSHGVKHEYHLEEAKTFNPFIVATNKNGVSDINTQERKGRKRKISDQILDSTVFPSKVQPHDLSKKMTKFVEANPSKRNDMPKRGRGRPPKAQSTKYSFTSNISMKYNDIDDVNVRRESYNTSLLKSEPSTPKRLQPGNGGITYRESLMKFCKNLGPTARKIAIRKLLGSQGLNYHPRHQLQPSMASSEAHSHPHFMNMNSTNSSLRYPTLNQVKASQPLINFGAFRTDDFKGKSIMVDDGKSNNLEFFGKQKLGVKICNNYQENVNQDFVGKNLGYGQVGNWRTMNQIGHSFVSNYNGNLINRNVNNINGIDQDVEGTPRNGINLINSSVYPSTYVQPFKEQELQLALASYMQMRDQQPKPKVWIESSWAQNQPSQFPDGIYQQQQQVLSYQCLFNNGDSQPQEGVLKPMPPQLWSQSAMFGVVPKQDLFPFGI